MDPLSVDLPAGDPVPSEDRVLWLGHMATRVALLESIPGAGPVRTASADSEDPSDDDHGGASPFRQ